MISKLKIGGGKFILADQPDQIPAVAAFQKLGGGKVELDVPDSRHQRWMIFDEAADPPELQQPDFGDPVVLFRDADEYLGRNRAKVWVAQAAECLEAHISARLGGINRLIVHLEEVLLQRGIQKTFNFLRVAETTQRLLVPLNPALFPRTGGTEEIRYSR